LDACPFCFLQYTALPTCCNCSPLYLEFTCRSAPLPFSGGACHTLATVGHLCHSKHTGGGGATPAFSGRVVYLQFTGGSAPTPLSRAQGSLPSLLRVFFFSAACLLFNLFFFSFFPGWGSVCPGSYTDLFQGVPHTAYLLTWWSVSPKQVRSWRLVAQEPSWFLYLMWRGDAVHGLGVWRCRSFAVSWWFFLPGVSPVSIQEFTLGSMLPASSL
jgi:hypothetical protein